MTISQSDVPYRNAPYVFIEVDDELLNLVQVTPAALATGRRKAS